MTSLADLLDSFGTQIAPGGFAVFSDFVKAENANIHTSAVPTAATISPAFARGRFPDLLLADVVLLRNGMDQHEAAAPGAVCGKAIPPVRDAGGFVAHLDFLIDRYDLASFFGHYPGHAANFDNDIRPHGVDWNQHEILDNELGA
jgi:hypothetical protein